jgi:thiol:disulfide interchange protein DsbD
MLQPLKGLAVAGTQHSQQNTHLSFQKIKGTDGLKQALATAKAQQKTVMLDFYADWCVSCKEMEKLTFSDPAVQAALKNSILLQADVTDNDAQDKELYKHFGIIGPPAIIFYDAEGKEQYNYRVVGYMPADKFSTHVIQAVN